MTKTTKTKTKTTKQNLSTSHNKLVSCYPPRRRCGISFSNTTSLTKQSFRDETNINTIMSRFQKTGIIDHLNTSEPHYGFAPSETYMEALDLIQNGEKSFNNLPSEMRQKFGNNPAEFLAFIENQDNLPEMASMGLLSESGTHAHTPSPNRSKGELDASAANNSPDPSPTVSNEQKA